MIRTLLIVALVVWALILLGRWVARVLAPVREIRRAVQQAREQATGAATSSHRPPERLLACALCGTRVPASRALHGVTDELVYCSERCRDAATSRASIQAAG